MSYQGVMRLAREHPFNPTKSGPPVFNVDWLKVVKGCNKVANIYGGKSFPGAAVADEIGWFPGLRLLEKYGILRPVGEPTRGGSRRYWAMPDIDGAARALRELGYL